MTKHVEQAGTLLRVRRGGGTFPHQALPEVLSNPPYSTDYTRLNIAIVLRQQSVAVSSQSSAPQAFSIRPAGDFFLESHTAKFEIKVAFPSRRNFLQEK